MSTIVPAHVIPVFAPRYEATPPDERVAYVRDEIRRLVREGGAVLLAILSPRTSTEAQVIALEMLRANRDNFRFAGAGSNPGPFGAKLIDSGHRWVLRLKAGATPPPLDPQGRRLPPEKAGKVLVAKVGMVEGDNGAERGDASQEWTGPARSIKAAVGVDLFVAAEVTFEPQAFDLMEAVHILRKWGVGTTLKQYLRPRNWRPGEYVDPDSPAARGQDQWLVEELPPSALDSRPAKKVA